jgi:aryl-alcohol dehydrogenase-like predicted oxidoreductase
VSALTLGGGGIGGVWGSTTRAEAVATVREAVERGITLFDLAPSYGDGEAERVVGEAFGNVDLPSDVRLTTKHQLGASPVDVYPRLRASLEASLTRMGREHVDVFFLHGMIIPDSWAGSRGTPRSLFGKEVRPAFERLVGEGLAGAWGITGVGVPSALLETIAEDPPPAAIQCVANLLDSPGGMHRYEDEEEPRPRKLIAAANARGIGVLGIRAVQAGALTDGFDRPLPDGDPEQSDFERARPFRAIARELGVTPAYLAHRYALSIEGVDSVILGVKNRSELRECLQAETDGCLDEDVVKRIDEAVSRH